jgi:hypothetical protein
MAAGRLRRLLVAVLAAALGSLAAVPPEPAAQAGFRVTQNVGRNTGAHVEVSGSVVNESRLDAVDVSVTVQALDAGGKTVARGITYVAPRIPPGGTASFVAKVPVMPAATGYRTVVSSYRFVQGVEGP